MKHVLILKTGESLASIIARRGDFEDWIRQTSGYPENHFQTVSVHNNEPLPPVAEIAGVIVTGSPAMVTEKLEWITTSEHYLLDAIDQAKPVLGICFGHQLLAQALGGRVDWHPQGREIGTTTLQLTSAAEGDPLLHNWSPEFPVHVTHMQSVMDLPTGSEILGFNDFDRHQAVRFTDRAWGIQFHPEFDEDIMAGYIRERFEVIRNEGLDADALLASVIPAKESEVILSRFMKLALS